MPEQDAAQAEFPSAPVLTAPRDERIVDGGNVAFAWEPVEGATEYYIEVAPDPSFESLLIDRNVGNATSLEPAERFPTDGRTFYWRVMAKNEKGWSHGDRVESFVSATPEFAKEHARPDRREEDSLGPAAELFYASGVEAQAEVMGDEARLEEERQMGVAHEGVEAGQILAIAVTTLIAVIIATLVVFFWSGSVAREARMAAVGQSGYPELRETEVEASRLLNQYDIVSEEEGTYRIPIDRAMSLLINERAAQRGDGEGPALPDSLP